MARKYTVPAQSGDNPNQPGVGPNKGDLSPEDIHWVTPPPKAPARRERVNAGPEGATPKALNKDQRRDLAGRIRRKLGLAASKRAR